MQTYISHSEAETESIGEKFAKDLPDGTVIAMYGDLGAGRLAAESVNTSIDIIHLHGYLIYYIILPHFSL